jgi:hypothetical protein
MSSSKVLIYILAILFLCAAGFVGFGLYQAHQRQVIQGGAVPVLPETAK